MEHNMLHHMLNLQNELQINAYGMSPVDIDDNEIKIEYIRNMILACADELHEALNEVGWKPWATSKYINEEAFKNELVDAWHFLMNLMLVIDMDAAELYKRYLAKREKNIKRQQEGYDGLNKCGMCKRAYDDDAVECFPRDNVKPGFCAATMSIVHD